MENNGTYISWRKNIKMMWNSPLQSGEKMNDGILDAWKNEMKEFAAQPSLWEINMKNSAADILNTIGRENDLVMLNAPVYVIDDHKAGEY